MATARQTTLSGCDEPYTFNRQCSGDRRGDAYALFLLEVQLADGEPVSTIGEAWDEWLQWSRDLGRSVGEVNDQ